MNRKKLKVGITGNIGSGKSLFSEYIRESGFQVLNADEISKDILANDSEVREKIIKKFGKEAYLNNLSDRQAGKINKKYLAEKIFTTPENVFFVNSLLHPKVINELGQRMTYQLKKSDFVFVEAALIYESGMEEMFDYVVLVISDLNVRKERKVSIDNLKAEDFMNRENHQIKEIEKKKKADFIFENNGTKEELKTKAGLLLNILGGLSN